MGQDGKRVPGGVGVSRFVLLDNPAHVRSRVARAFGVAPEIEQFVTTLTERAELILDGGHLPVDQVEDSRARLRTVTVQTARISSRVSPTSCALRMNRNRSRFRRRCHTRGSRPAYVVRRATGARL